MYFYPLCQHHNKYGHASEGVDTALAYILVAIIGKWEYSS